MGTSRGIPIRSSRREATSSVTPALEPPTADSAKENAARVTSLTRELATRAHTQRTEVGSAIALVTPVAVLPLSILATSEGGILEEVTNPLGQVSYHVRVVPGDITL